MGYNEEGYPISPNLIALRRLNGYNSAESSRDVSLICARFQAQSITLLTLFLVSLILLVYR